MDTKQLQLELADYSGGFGRLWDFSPTHNRLVVELVDKGRKRTSYLVMLGTHSLQVPTSWKISELRLQHVEDYFVLEDHGVKICFSYEAVLQSDY